MTCTASVCKCKRCGTSGPGDRDLALQRAVERRKEREAKDLAFVASREKHLPAAGYEA